MRYVERDQAGRVVGHYANPQRHRDDTPYATEALPEDHADIAAFDEARRTRPQAATVAQRLDALEAQLAEALALLRAGKE